MRRFARCLLGVMLAGAVLSACGGDEEKATDLAVTIKEDGAKVAIGIPSTIDGGVVNLTLTNSGQGIHSLQFIKVADNHTTAEWVAFLDSSEDGAPIPDWVSEGGGIGTVAPGQTDKASFELSEGRHFAWDDETDDNDVSNITKDGGIIEVTVSSKGGGELPDAVGTVTAKEYSFTVEALKAGDTTVRFQNDGVQLHHWYAFPMTPGATIEQVKEFLSSDGPPAADGPPPPLDFEGGVGTAVIDGGGAVVADMKLVAGDYAILCFINDRAGGPPHFTKGMLQKITVA